MLFSHLVEAKGFNSLICIKKYIEIKYLKNKIDSYVLELIKSIFKNSDEKMKLKFENSIKKLIDTVNTVPNELVKNMQLLFIDAFYTAIFEGSSKINYPLLQIIKSQLVPE